MSIKSLDPEINAVISGSQLLRESDGISSPQAQAILAKKALSEHGINAVARVTESGDVEVKKVLLG